MCGLLWAIIFGGRFSAFFLDVVLGAAPSLSKEPASMVSDVMQINYLTSLLDSHAYMQSLPTGLIWMNGAIHTLRTLVKLSGFQSHINIYVEFDRFSKLNEVIQDQISKRNVEAHVAICSMIRGNDELTNTLTASVDVNMDQSLVILLLNQIQGRIDAMIPHLTELTKHDSSILKSYKQQRDVLEKARWHIAGDIALATDFNLSTIRSRTV